jgi:predicted RNA binding protein YcfA (HicA-like mRNA interferase family)
MKSSELVRIAIKYGWKFSNQAATSHREYVKDGKNVVIPFHASKEVPTGTCKAILKKLKGGNK